MIIPIHARPTAEQIAHFENHIGYALPKDYRDMLATYNGGLLSPNTYTKRGLAFYLDGLYSLHGNRLIRQQKPPAAPPCICIGFSDTGNNFYLNVVDGEVRYWDHEVHPYQIPYQKLPMIAPSFTHLIDNLTGTQWLEAPDEIDLLGVWGTAHEVEDFAHRHGIEATGKSRQTVLQAAAEAGNYEAVMAAIECQASLVGTIAHASRSYSIPIVQLLLSQGAQAHEPDQFGRTATEMLRSGSIEADWRNYLQSVLS